MRFEVIIEVSIEKSDEADLCEDYGDIDTYKEDAEVGVGDAVEALLRSLDIEYMSVERVSVPVKLKD